MDKGKGASSAKFKLVMALLMFVACLSSAQSGVVELYSGSTIESTSQSLSSGDATLTYNTQCYKESEGRRCFLVLSLPEGVSLVQLPGTLQPSFDPSSISNIQLYPIATQQTDLVLVGAQNELQLVQAGSTISIADLESGLVDLYGNTQEYSKAAGIGGIGITDPPLFFDTQTLNIPGNLSTSQSILEEPTSHYAVEVDVADMEAGGSFSITLETTEGDATFEAYLSTCFRTFNSQNGGSRIFYSSGDGQCTMVDEIYSSGIGLVDLETDGVDLLPGSAISFPLNINTVANGGVGLSFESFSTSIRGDGAHHRYLMDVPDENMVVGAGEINLSADVPILGVELYGVDDFRATPAPTSLMSESRQTMVQLRTTPTDKIDTSIYRQYVLEVVTPQFVTGEFNFSINLMGSGVEIFLDPIITCGGYLDVDDETYNMNESCTIDGADAFTVIAKGVTLNCEGFEVNTTTSGYGVISIATGNTNVRNCNFNTVNSAIYYDSFEDGSIIDVVAHSQVDAAIGISTANHITILNVRASSESGAGFLLRTSESHTIIGLQAESASTYGAEMTEICPGDIGSIIQNSSFIGVGDDIALTTMPCFANFTNNTGTGGKPILYYSNTGGENYPAGLSLDGLDVSMIFLRNFNAAPVNLTNANASNGGMIFWNVFGSVFENLSSQSNINPGILLHDETSSNSFSNINIISGNATAFAITGCSYNQFSNINATAFNAPAVYFSDSSTANVMENSTLFSENYQSVLFDTAFNNNISNSNITAGSSYGVMGTESTGNALKNNRINGGTAAVGMQTASNNFVFSGNTLFGTSFGVYMIMGGTNQFNEFINNTIKSDGVGVRIRDDNTNNTFCLNNFSSENGIYVSDVTGENFLNCTYDGKSQGNIYGNVVNGSVNITSSGIHSSIPGFDIGNGGAGYPYNATTSQGGFSNLGTDYAPLVPTLPGNLTVNATDGVSVAGNNSTFLPPANLTIYSNTSTGFTFIGWTVTTGNCTILNASSQDTQVEILDASWCNVQASAIKQGNLTVNATDGVSVAGNNSTFLPPANLTIYSNTSTGFTFIGWTVTTGNCTILNASSQDTQVEILDASWCNVQASASLNTVGGGGYQPGNVTAWIAGILNPTNTITGTILGDFQVPMMVYEVWVYFDGLLGSKVLGVPVILFPLIIIIIYFLLSGTLKSKEGEDFFGSAWDYGLLILTLLLIAVYWHILATMF